ncbi:MAG: MFS transporter [Acidimicrobiia bacterium]|nr:MFS transporter [Acidimicrobiia bacterium]
MWVLGLVILIDQVDQNIVRGVIPQLKHDFGIGDAEIGLLLSIFVLVNGLITVPAGYLADRWHRTRTIGHTVIAWSGVTMITAAAQNFGQLLAGRALLGFGQAVTEPSANSLISDFYPTNVRARAFSFQQIMGLIGAAVGLTLGGVVGAAFGWQWAFIAVGPPGILIALIAYRLREPRRGHADRLHLGAVDDDYEPEPVKLFEHGIGRFFSNMWRGLVQDMRVILAIPTLRFALVGVGALLFTAQAVGAWLAPFHDRYSGLTQAESTLALGLLLIIGGIPGLLMGGRVADRYATRIRGARVVIPAACIAIGVSFFAVSYLPMPFALSWSLELVGMFTIWLAVPGLRAGVADAVPAHLRGAGFGAFNIVSVILGAAAAPFVVGQLAELTNLRTALWLVTPPVYVGAYVLFKARDHLDADAAKIFEAVLAAIQAEQAEADGTTESEE